MDLRDTEIAWAAGFIEGEGCFTAQKTGESFSARVQVTQVAREPLDRLQRIFGFGKIYVRPAASPRHNDIHVYVAQGRGRAETVVGAIWPHLSRRRKKQIWDNSLKVRGFSELIDIEREP